MPRVRCPTLGLDLSLSLPQQRTNLNARGLGWSVDALKRWMEAVTDPMALTCAPRAFAIATLANYRSKPLRLNLHCTNVAKRRGTRTTDEHKRVPVPCRSTRQGRRNGREAEPQYPNKTHKGVGGTRTLKPVPMGGHSKGPSLNARVLGWSVDALSVG